MLKTLRSPQFVHDFILGIMPLLFGFNLLTSIGFLPHALHGKADFRQLYAAAYMVRTGHSHELYSYNAQEQFQNRVVSKEAYPLPFIRPASQALLFAPLTNLSYPVAYCAFSGINLSLLVLCFFLLQPWTRNLAKNSKWKPITIFLSFTPLAYGISQGQDTILLLTFFTATLYVLRRGNVLAAGALAGLGSFKFQFTIPILILFACWRRWKFCAGFMAAAFALVAISIRVTDIQEIMIYARSLLLYSSGRARQADLVHYAPGLSVGEMPNLHGVVHGIIGFPSVEFSAFITAGLALALWLCRRCHNWPLDRQFIIALNASVILSYYAFMGDLAIILPPLAAALDLCASNAQVRARVLVVSAAMLTLLAPACLWFFPLHFYVVGISVLVLLAALALSRLEPHWV